MKDVKFTVYDLIAFCVTKTLGQKELRASKIAELFCLIPKELISVKITLDNQEEIKKGIKEIWREEKKKDITSLSDNDLDEAIYRRSFLWNMVTAISFNVADVAEIIILANYPYYDFDLLEVIPKGIFKISLKTENELLSDELKDDEIHEIAEKIRKYTDERFEAITGELKISKKDFLEWINGNLDEIPSKVAFFAREIKFLNNLAFAVLHL